MAPPLAPEEPFIRQNGAAMRKDPCYMPYAEALQCLDKHDYQQELCTQAFAAFKACRNKQEEATHISRLKTGEKDPLWGWAFKLYNQWSAERQASSSSSSDGSSSSKEEYHGWRPPPEDSAEAAATAADSSSSSSSRLKAFEKDPLWGWAFRWYNGISAAEDSSVSSNSSSNSNSSSSSSSSNSRSDQQHTQQQSQRQQNS